MNFAFKAMEVYSYLGLAATINVEFSAHIFDDKSTGRCITIVSKTHTGPQTITVRRAWVVGAHLHISTKDSKQVVYEGGNVTLPCTVVGNEFNAFLNPIIWYKLSHDEETQYQVNTAAVITPPFDETTIYMIEPDQTTQPHSQVLMPLTINNVTLAENGTYRCELRSRYKVLSTVSHRIIVPASVDSMTFISDTPNYTLSEFNTPANKRTDYVSFIMNENETASISCRTHGGNPRPQLHIYQDSEDISDQFQRTESVNVVGKPGLQSVVHDIKLSADRFQVSADNRGDILKCVAKVTRFPHLKKTKSRELEVRYAPKFECANRMFAFPDSGNFTIECSIHSNPAVDGHSVHWSFEDVGINDSVVQNNMYHGDVIGVYKANSEVNTDTGIIDVRLTIRNVTRATYKVYNLVASNRIGRTEMNIAFMEAVTTLEPSTEENIWEVKYNNKGVYKVKNENDVIKASSSRENGSCVKYTSSLLVFVSLIFLCIL